MTAPDPSPTRAAAPRTVVAKIGTSSISDDDGALLGGPIEKFCGEVAGLRASGHRVVMVSSGAIAAGLLELGLGGNRRPRDVGTLQAVSTVGQCALMTLYRSAMAQHGLVAGQVLLVPFDFVIRSQYLHATTTLRRMLDLGVVPVVNENDAIADDEIRWGDNDRIAALVANLVNADLLVLLTDTPGVLTADPRRDSNAAIIDEIDDLVDAGGNPGRLGGSAGTIRGSGGMASKLTAAQVAAWSGVPTVIADAARAGVLNDAVAGVSGVGTLVRARDTRLPARKLWIGLAATPQGGIVVDAGARAALGKGRSLLAIGVRSVIGSFDTGSPVEVSEAGGAVFARGLVRPGSEELRQVAGRRSGDLPPGAPHIVIHADDLVLLQR